MRSHAVPSTAANSLSPELGSVHALTPEIDGSAELREEVQGRDGDINRDSIGGVKNPVSEMPILQESALYFHRGRRPRKADEVLPVKRRVERNSVRTKTAHEANSQRKNLI